MGKRVISEEARKKQSETMKKVRADPNSIFNSEETRRKTAESTKRTWEDSEVRRKRVESLKGHEVSQESRRKISESNLGQKRGPASEERKEKISKALTGRKQSGEHRQRNSEGHKGQKPHIHTVEERQKISDGVKRAWEEGRNTLHNNFGASAGYHNGVWMRCLNSEGVFARELDEAGIKWVYEPKRFRLSWCTYLPDFYLPEFNIYVEVKGWMHPDSQRKIDSFRRETGKTLVVVFQSELPTMEYASI